MADKRNPIVKEIVAEWLKSHGYSGLWNEDAECGCHLDCLIECDGPCHECEAGYLQTCNCGDHDFHIGRHNQRSKPETEFKSEPEPEPEPESRRRSDGMELLPDGRPWFEDERLKTLPMHMRGDGWIRIKNLEAGKTICKRCDGTGNEMFSMFCRCKDCFGRGYVNG